MTPSDRRQADDGGGRGLFAVVADANTGLLTPDMGPSRTGSSRTQDGSGRGSPHYLQNNSPKPDDFP
jgi:hypothetical protein